MVKADPGTDRYGPLKFAMINERPEINYSQNAVVWLRIVGSLAWLDSALIGKDAKLSPTFLSGQGLVQSINDNFMRSALTPGISSLLQNVVVPHSQAFALIIGFGDLAIGISLFLGLFARLGAIFAILRALTNILVAGGAGPDTIGFNSMLITAGVIVIVTGAGRRFGLDGAILAKWPNNRILCFAT